MEDFRFQQILLNEWCGVLQSLGRPDPLKSHNSFIFLSNRIQFKNKNTLFYLDTGIELIMKMSFKS